MGFRVQGLGFRVLGLGFSGGQRILGLQPATILEVPVRVTGVVVMVVVAAAAVGVSTAVATSKGLSSKHPGNAAQALESAAFHRVGVENPMQRIAEARGVGSSLRFRLQGLGHRGFRLLHLGLRVLFGVRGEEPCVELQGLQVLVHSPALVL